MTYNIDRLLHATQILHEEIGALTRVAVTRQDRPYDPLRDHLSTLRRLLFELRQTACDIHVATDDDLWKAKEENRG